MGKKKEARKHEADVTEKMGGKRYEAELEKLHVELVKLQEWVVAKGLKAGDPVVVDGAIKLAPGAPVKVTGPAK